MEKNIKIGLQAYMSSWCFICKDKGTTIEVDLKVDVALEESRKYACIKCLKELIKEIKE